VSHLGSFPESKKCDGSDKCDGGLQLRAALGTAAACCWDCHAPCAALATTHAAAWTHPSWHSMTQLGMPCKKIQLLVKCICQWLRQCIFLPGFFTSQFMLHHSRSKYSTSQSNSQSTGLAVAYDPTPQRLPLKHAFKQRRSPSCASDTPLSIVPPVGSWGGGAQAP
jgi:hypothetical protein